MCATRSSEGGEVDGVLQVRRLHLSTKDADGFYLRLGFRWSDEVCSVPWKRLFLSLDRG